MNVPPIEVMVILIVFFSVWSILALAACIHPRFFLKVAQKPKGNREPSQAYIIYLRILGILLFIFGLYMLISLLFQK